MDFPIPGQWFWLILSDHCSNRERRRLPTLPRFLCACFNCISVFPSPPSLLPPLSLLSHSAFFLFLVSNQVACLTPRLALFQPPRCWAYWREHHTWLQWLLKMGQNQARTIENLLVFTTISCGSYSLSQVNLFELISSVSFYFLSVASRKI